MTAKKTAPFAAASAAELLGEVITWNCSGVSIQHPTLVAALRDAGLDEAVARELAPRHAFARACRKLSEQRIIRQVAEDAATITFQFTKESLEGETFKYSLEAKLELEKATGKVTCTDSPELEARAQAALDECIGARTAGDVTRVIQKLFERKADLFPIREQGGCYFVPAEHQSFLERIDAFVRVLNGKLGRFPIPKGTPHGDRSVRDAVADGLEAVVEEHRRAIEEFTTDTRGGTIERAAERIRQTRFKVEAYAEYLGSQRERLEDELTAAQERLRERVEELTAAEVDETAFIAETDSHWGFGVSEEQAVARLRRHGRHKDGDPLAYRVWRVHPDATVGSDGKIESPAGKPAPVLVREVKAEEAAVA